MTLLKYFDSPRYMTSKSNEIYFVMNDISKQLGYTKASNALGIIVPEAKTYGELRKTLKPHKQRLHKNTKLITAEAQLKRVVIRANTKYSMSILADILKCELNLGTKYVYIFEDLDLCAVKIGISEHPQQRIKSFKANLGAIYYIEGTQELERHLHKVFMKNRIRTSYSTEVFKVTFEEAKKELLKSSIIQFKLTY